MKIKSLVGRNFTILANHQASRGEVFSVLIPAGSTIELSDSDYSLIKLRVAELVSKKVLEITVQPELKATKAEILKAVEADKGIKLDSKSDKETLAAQALALGVEID